MMNSACKPAAAPNECRGGSGSSFPMGVGHRMPSRFLANAEPPLDEMMSDEVMRRVMARDGVEVTALMSLIDEVRGRLA